jgi:hypothetical protein
MPWLKSLDASDGTVLSTAHWYAHHQFYKTSALANPVVGTCLLEANFGPVVACCVMRPCQGGHCVIVRQSRAGGDGLLRRLKSCRPPLPRGRGCENRPLDGCKVILAIRTGSYLDDKRWQRSLYAGGVGVFAKPTNPALGLRCLSTMLLIANIPTTSGVCRHLHCHGSYHMLGSAIVYQLQPVLNTGWRDITNWLVAYNA